MKLLAAAFPFAATALAQFTGLATNDNGSQLYFSSSFQLAGTTGENAHENIFSYDGADFRSVAQR